MGEVLLHGLLSLLHAQDQGTWSSSLPRKAVMGFLRDFATLFKEHIPSARVGSRELTLFLAGVTSPEVLGSSGHFDHLIWPTPGN